MVFFSLGRSESTPACISKMMASSPGKMLCATVRVAQYVNSAVLPAPAGAVPNVGVETQATGVRDECRCVW